jgi:hypothetical protein
MEPKEIIKDPEKVTRLSSQSTISFIKKVDRLLSELKEQVLVELKTQKEQSPELIIIGDTHGDYITTRSVLNDFFFGSPDNINPKPGKHVLFLGDYIDRPPHDCKNGSFINIMYVLALKLVYPNRMTLLRGNHEAFEVIPSPPSNLPDDLVDLFGDDGAFVLERFKMIFRKFPLMFRTKNGILGVHSGIFKKPKTLKEIQELDRNEYSVLGVTTWAEPDEHAAPRIDINVNYNFNFLQFKDFLWELGSRVLVRGHTPGLAGKASYADRCITLFTNR